VNLPGQTAQGLYLDIGWAIVLAALVLALLGRRAGRLGVLLGVCGAIALGISLPAPWSPSFWLGMAFQYPSLMLVALAGLQLLRMQNPARWAGSAPLLSTLPAATLCVVAAAVYAGAFAFVPYDPYAFGYLRFAGAAGATVLVLLWTRFDRHSGWSCLAVAAAATLHAGTRLPSGNAWDALFDPFLVAWAAFVVLCAARDRFRRPSPALITESFGDRS